MPRRQGVIRAGVLRGYWQLTSLLRHDPQPFLAQSGLSASDLDDPDRLLPRSAVSALLDLTAARLGQFDFGLQLARMQDIGTLGEIAFAARSASDWGGAIAAIAEHVHRHSPMGSITIKPGTSADERRIVFGCSAPITGVQLTEHALGLFCIIRRHLIGDRPPMRVTFPHAPVSPPEVYLKHFGVAPEFGSDAASVCVDKREFRLPLATSDPLLRRIAEEHLRRKTHAPRASVRRR